MNEFKYKINNNNAYISTRQKNYIYATKHVGKKRQNVFISLLSVRDAFIIWKKVKVEKSTIAKIKTPVQTQTKQCGMPTDTYFCIEVFANSMKMHEMCYYSHRFSPSSGLKTVVCDDGCYCTTG